MTGQERHLHRDSIARRNGYRPQPVPSSPEWAGTRLPEDNDERAAIAAARLRGIEIGKDAQQS